MPILFRPSLASDFSKIEALLTDNNLPTTDLAVANPLFWVALEGETLISCVGVEQHGHWGILRSLAVADTHKGQGLGKAIYAKALDAALELGILHLTLLTQTAERFFANLGWEKVERTTMPESVAASTEFAGICPSSAVCMTLSLKPIVAKQLFSQGFNCAQSVFVPFAIDLGMDKAQALKLATGFGAGIAQHGEICGAVSGAIMALGLIKGRCDIADTHSRDTTYALVNELIDQFEKKHGSIVCKKLLGVDISQPQGLNEAKNQSLFGSVCPQYVLKASEIIETLIKS